MRRRGSGPVTQQFDHWAVRHGDGRIEVNDEKPADAEIFAAAALVTARAARAVE